MILLKYLKIDTDLRIILLDQQNNYVAMISNAVLQSFVILAISLNVLYNYFDSPKFIIHIWLDFYFNYIDLKIILLDQQNIGLSGKFVPMLKEN